MPFNPIAASIDAGTEALESGGEAVRRTSLLPKRAAEIATIDVGQTPAEVVYEENKLELLHYEPLTEEQNDIPIIIVYALINKPYILDLQPDRSVVRRLLEAGHDVYLVDWNEPSRLDSHLGIADYVDRYMDNCVDVVRDRSGQDAINVLGYCMGGTMSAMYAALYPEKVNTLGLMAAGLCFEDTGGLLEEWGDDDYFDPREVSESFGNMPSWFLDVGFALMDPVDNYVSKYVTLSENLESDAFVRNFARMERWLSEGIDLAGSAYAEFLEKIYQDNQLYRNELEIGGRHVDVERIDMPVLQIVGEYDHLIPSESSLPFNDVVGTDDVTTIEYPTGHIGMSVSSSTHEAVWPKVSDWYHEKSAEAAGRVEGGVEAEADVSVVDGIGPTYADRLHDAGIETVGDFVDAGDGEIASAADVSEERVRQWRESAVVVDTDAGADAPTPAEASETAGKPEQVETPSEPGSPPITETDTAAEAAADAERDVEVINGIGPTYAERLRDAGVETVADLAERDPADIAEIAGVGESRARRWLEER